MCLEIKWFEPWDKLRTEPFTFEQELQKEVGEHHILCGKRVKAIGRRYDFDDYLFEVFDSEFKYAVVHLTYSKKIEDNPVYPKTKVFMDINDWIENCMDPDHAEYMADEEG